VKLLLRSTSNHVLENFGLLFDIVQISFTIKNGLCIYYLNIKIVITILESLLLRTYFCKTYTGHLSNTGMGRWVLRRGSGYGILCMKRLCTHLLGQVYIKH
jgi:hypothetical protein